MQETLQKFLVPLTSSEIMRQLVTRPPILSNKSWDASGDSMFRKIIGAAVGL
jgi:hypothetical protein